MTFTFTREVFDEIYKNVLNDRNIGMTIKQAMVNNGLHSPEFYAHVKLYGKPRLRSEYMNKKKFEEIYEKVKIRSSETDFKTACEENNIDVISFQVYRKRYGGKNLKDLPLSEEEFDKIYESVKNAYEGGLSMSSARESVGNSHASFYNGLKAFSKPNLKSKKVFRILQ